MTTEIIYFSATGTTKAIAKAIAEGIGGDIIFSDITLPESREVYKSNSEADLIIVAVPVYEEKIPEFLTETLGKIEGVGKPFAAVAVYGNIGFGESLIQFGELAKDKDLKYIAAGAFIGQHTYTSQKAPVALGRPDANDLSEAAEFGRKIREKIEAGDMSEISLPKPESPKLLSMLPGFVTDLLILLPKLKKTGCIDCSLCAKKCPVGAIDETTYEIDPKKCVRCYACVQSCPKSARKHGFSLPIFRIIFNRIGSGAKENVTFF